MQNSAKKLGDNHFLQKLEVREEELKNMKTKKESPHILLSFFHHLGAAPQRSQQKKRQELLQSFNSCSLQLDGCELSGFQERLSGFYYKTLTGTEDDKVYFSIREEMEERVGLVVGSLAFGGYRSRLHLFVSCLIGLLHFFALGIVCV